MKSIYTGCRRNCLDHSYGLHMTRRWRQQSQLYSLPLLLDLMWKMISNVTLISAGFQTFILLVLHRATSPHLQSIEPIHGFHKLLNIPAQFQHHNSNLLHSNLPWEENKSHSWLLAAAHKAVWVLLFMAVCHCTWACTALELKTGKKNKRTRWITKIATLCWNQVCRLAELPFEQCPLLLVRMWRHRLFKPPIFYLSAAI